MENKFVVTDHKETTLHPLDRDYNFLTVLRSNEPLGQIVYILLNRPEKRNALNNVLWRELGSVFSRVGRMGDDCRAVVVAGCGSSFCAGIDLSDNTLLPTSAEKDVARTGLSFVPQILDMQAAFTAIEECPVPVVAAIHGYCVGAGVDLVCCADIRVASADAVFSVREVAIGLTADVGTLQRFPKIVGNQSAVRELCLTGRNFTAQEALQLGFVSRLCPVDELAQHVSNVCRRIASHSPVAVHGTKKALLYSRDHSVHDGLNQVAFFNALALQSSDLETSFRAKGTKMKPTFRLMPKQSRL